MLKYLDLHIHSRYSRACSRDLTLENIGKACEIKGIDIVATGDFTHPAWFKSIENELERAEDGASDSFLYALKGSRSKTRFMLSTEISLIYKAQGKTRRVHMVIHAPSTEAVRSLNSYLEKGYKIKSDGRPILGMSAPDLVSLCLSIDPKFLLYPAHIWTPWFSVFGSKSGFDTLEECFGDQTGSIYAIETGLSSDPEMNWRFSGLDSLTILSNSDAHSLNNIAREANAMDLDTGSYDEIYEAIRNKDLEKIKFTVEFYPEEGMYHFDGHRACAVSLKPEDTRGLGGICPKCGKELTIGVLNRVEELADRPQGYRPKISASYVKTVELDKIIAETLGIKSRNSKQVKRIYDRLADVCGNELQALLETPYDVLAEAGSAAIAEAIKNMREGRVLTVPGFDGQYGHVRVTGDGRSKTSQAGLFASDWD